ncbi:PREDICTED: uncharacterized protein LOC108523694 [Rhinopithecus bieti]|uniref:uncharacterized protein LOC108523694 n=1 Tax=Rhinopithecus bieti TaxID=61621 RepID=UPI00083C0999|nr:PREDICTED: uncharacterized protein LOC108523694 [Rhinopithecus bieti]
MLVGAALPLGPGVASAQSQRAGSRVLHRWPRRTHAFPSRPPSLLLHFHLRVGLLPCHRSCECRRPFQSSSSLFPNRPPRRWHRTPRTFSFYDGLFGPFEPPQRTQYGKQMVKASRLLDFGSARSPFTCDLCRPSRWSQAIQPCPLPLCPDASGARLFRLALTSSRQPTLRDVANTTPPVLLVGRAEAAWEARGDRKRAVSSSEKRICHQIEFRPLSLFRHMVRIQIKVVTQSEMSGKAFCRENVPPPAICSQVCAARQPSRNIVWILKMCLFLFLNHFIMYFLIYFVMSCF